MQRKIGYHQITFNIIKSCTRLIGKIEKKYSVNKQEIKSFQRHKRTKVTSKLREL